MQADFSVLPSCLNEHAVRLLKTKGSSGLGFTDNLGVVCIHHGKSHLLVLADKVFKCPVSTKDAFCVRTMPENFIKDVRLVVKKLRKAPIELASAPIRAAMTKETFLAKMKEEDKTPSTPAKKAKVGGA